MVRVNPKIGTPRVEFNPAFYKKARKAYGEGRMRDIIALMREAATDGHVAGCLIGRNAGFQRSYTVTSPDEYEIDPDLLAWMSRTIRRLRPHALLKRLHEAVKYEFAVVDFPEWDTDDRGFQVPTRYQYYEQKYFRYEGEGHSRRIVVDWGKTFQEVGEATLVAECEEMAAMLPVLAAFILIEFGREAWTAFMEVFGMGIIIGYYPPGVDDTIKDATQDAVDSIAMRSRGTAPKGSEIVIHEAGRNTGDHKDYIQEAKEDISVALLGHANAVKNSRGLQVGENLTSYKVRFELAVDDMLFLDEQMQRLVDLIWAQNIGDGRPPVFQLDKTPPLDISEELRKLETAFRHGARYHVDHLRKLGLTIHPDQEWIEPPQQISFGV